MSSTAANYLDKCRTVLTSTEEQLATLQADWLSNKREDDDYEIGSPADKVTILCDDIKTLIEQINSLQTA